MAEIQDMINDPKFWDLSPASREAVLRKVDKRFAGMSPEAQKVFVSRLTPKSSVMSKPAPEEEPDPLQTIIRTTGGIVGGVTAGRVPGLQGVGRLVGEAVGVGLGAAAAEGYYQVGQQFAGTERAPRTTIEALKEMGEAAGIEGGIEFGTQAVTRGVGKALAPFAKKMVPEAKKTMQYLRKYMNPPFMPAEVSESKVLQILNNISEYSMLGGSKVAEFRMARSKVMDEIAGDVIDSFGPKIGSYEAGELFLDAIEKRNKTFHAVADTLYNSATQAAQGVRVPTGNLKALADKWMDVASELGGIEATHAGDDLAKAVMTLGDDISVEAAKDLRSRLLTIERNYEVLNNKAPAYGKAKALLKTLDQDIRSSLPPDALNKWNVANHFYKDMQDKFNHRIIRRLVKKGEENPSEIAKAVFQNGKVERVRKIKGALTPQEWTSMQSYHVQSLLKDAGMENAEGIVSGKALMNRMFGKTGYKEEVMKEIYSPEQLKELKNFANALYLSQKKQAEGLGRMWVQLAQGTAIIQVAGAVGGAIGATYYDEPKYGLAGGVILFGPMVLSKMMTKPSMVRYLTRGFQIPASSPEVVGLSARLLRGAADTHKEMMSEQD